MPTSFADKATCNKAQCICMNDVVIHVMIGATEEQLNAKLEELARAHFKDYKQVMPKWPIFVEKTDEEMYKLYRDVVYWRVEETPLTVYDVALSVVA